MNQIFTQFNILQNFVILEIALNIQIVFNLT